MLKRISLKNDLDIDISPYKVSIVIATYNGEKYIKELLESIFKQTVLPAEIIITDDGSIDSTLDIIYEFKLKRDKGNIIKVVRNADDKHGHVYNFYNGLKYVTSDFVFLCDQDDVWLENKLEIMTKLLVKYNLKAIHSNEYYTDSKLKIHSYYKYMHRNMRLYNDRDFDKRHLYLLDFDYIVKCRFEPNGCCMAFDKCLIEYFNKYIEKYPVLKPFGQDYIIFYISALVGRCAFVNLPLIYRRIHGDNVMGKESEDLHPKDYLQEINHRERYLYRFLYYINEIVRIKNYKYLRFYAYNSLHMVNWIIYSFFKELSRKITDEEGREVL